MPTKHFLAQTIDFLLPSSTHQKLDPILFYYSNKMAIQGLHLTALENGPCNGGPKSFALNGMKYDKHQHGLFEFCCLKLLLKCSIS